MGKRVVKHPGKRLAAKAAATIATEQKEFTEVEISRLCKAARAGILDHMLAWIVAIPNPKFQRMLQANPSVALAIKSARASKVRDVGEALLRKALRGDTIAMIFFLKCHGLWRENTKIEIEGMVEGMVRRVRYEPLTKEEMKAIRERDNDVSGPEQPPSA